MYTRSTARPTLIDEGNTDMNFRGRTGLCGPSLLCTGTGTGGGGTLVGNHIVEISGSVQ
jgi:hypothetical protein